MRHVLGGVPGELTTLPGCSQVVVSHSVFVPLSERGKGKGKSSNLARQQACRVLGYDLMVCTVDLNNLFQIKCLESNGWTLLISFVSNKTGHTVGLYALRL